ncbi:RNA polymerase sigma factor [Patulibacter sp. NPDC049589]|uniref:RNA polymerase sigma factor n=1 Tax=Patulibacter sp. NPDC049589 TaxID=3154731 RepID=UPI0034227ADB
MSDPPDDDALLAAAQRDGAAFEAVFDRHFAAIHRFAAHRIDRDAADEIAAETFVRAYAARMRAHTVEGSLRAWLCTIANNLVRDELRRRERAGRAGLRLRGTEASAGPRAAAALDPARGLPRDPALDDAVAALREEEREALLLLAWGELSYAEIAVATGVALGTVRSRLHRAREDVRARLAREGRPPGAPVPHPHGRGRDVVPAAVTPTPRSVEQR